METQNCLVSMMWLVESGAQSTFAAVQRGESPFKPFGFLSAVAIETMIVGGLWHTMLKKDIGASCNQMRVHVTRLLRSARCRSELECNIAQRRRMVVYRGGSGEDLWAKNGRFNSCGTER